MSTDCCICFETIGSTNSCVTPCGHHFCFNCIMKASQYNSNCPYCRAQLHETTTDANTTINENNISDQLGLDLVDWDTDEEGIMFDSPLIGKIDYQGHYTMPLNIETIHILQQVWGESVPEGYDQSDKIHYTHDTDNSSYILNYLHSEMPYFDIKDMTDESVDKAKIQYEICSEKMMKKSIEIFHRTRLIMKVIKQKSIEVKQRMRHYSINICLNAWLDYKPGIKDTSAYSISSEIKIKI